MIKKNNAFANRLKGYRILLHRILRETNQRITTDSVLQRFVTHFFTRLPWRQSRAGST
jgi:hypothetical protein